MSSVDKLQRKREIIASGSVTLAGISFLILTILIGIEYLTIVYTIRLISINVCTTLLFIISFYLVYKETGLTGEIGREWLRTTEKFFKIGLLLIAISTIITPMIGVASNKLINMPKVPENTTLEEIVGVSIVEGIILLDIILVFSSYSIILGKYGKKIKSSVETIKSKFIKLYQYRIQKLHYPFNEIIENFLKLFIIAVFISLTLGFLIFLGVTSILLFFWTSIDSIIMENMMLVLMLSLTLLISATSELFDRVEKG